MSTGKREVRPADFGSSTQRARPAWLREASALEPRAAFALPRAAFSDDPSEQATGGNMAAGGAAGRSSTAEAPGASARARANAAAAQSASEGSGAVMDKQAVAQLIEAAEADARARGAAEGRAIGEAQGRAVFEEVATRLNAVVTDLASLGPRLRAQVEGQLLSLAVSIAEQIIARELCSDRDYLSRLVHEAIALFDEPDQLHVKVNPADLDVAGPLLEASCKDLPVPCRIRVSADPTVDTGCTIETAIARVDARVSERLANVRSALTGGGSA